MPILIIAGQMTAGQVVPTCSDPRFQLQIAPMPSGTFTNIPGATSPYTNSTSGTQQFFRLITD